MPENRRLTAQERETAKEILEQIREHIKKASQEDNEHAFALRRYIYKNLMYDERGTPMQRRKLKTEKLLQQGAKCAECGKQFLESEEPELDRIDAVKGYTKDNTRLIHHECHRRKQLEKGFK